MRTIATAVIVTAVLLVGPLFAFGATTAAATARDGHKDFDFLFGTWRTHYKLLRHRLSNNHEWYDCEGASVIRHFWNGSANLEDGDLHCPPPRGYVHGMTLRLYDAASHQWSLYWGTTKLGLVMPPQVGHFDKNGVGEFFAHDTFQGKPIIVRFRWTVLKGDHPHFEQAFSADNGGTWETNWITDYTRTTPATSGGGG